MSCAPGGPSVRPNRNCVTRRGGLRLLSKFAPAGLVDAGIRKDLRLDAVVASPGRSPVLER